MVIEIVLEYFSWPTGLFIPQDPCDIVFWDISMELRCSEALMVISDRFKINDIEEIPIREKTFEEFILFLKKRGHGVGPR